MKRSIFLSALAAAALLPAIGSAQLTTNWQINVGDQAFFANDNNVRGMGYNPINDTVLVVSRTGGLSVQSLDAADGTVGTPLNVTGITGGTFPLNDVDVTAEGVIYGTNLVLSGDLKIYRWADESSAPTLVATISALPTRYGDSLALRGVDSDNSTELFVGGNGSGSLLRLVTTDNGASFAVAGTNGNIATGQSTSWGGILPRTDNTNVIVASLGETVKELQLDGTLVAEGDGGVIGASFGYGALKYDGSTIYMGLQVGNATPALGRIFDITAGIDVGNVFTAYNTPDMGTNSNGNGAGDVEFANDGSMIVLSTNNAIGSYAVPPASVADWTMMN